MKNNKHRRKADNIKISSQANKDNVNSIKHSGLVALSQAHHLPQSTGHKATRLGQLIEAGYNVPKGFVITGEITDRILTQPASPMLSKAELKALEKLWKELSAKHVAVRSSGADEDGTHSSFAGTYKSILEVSRDNLESAVKEVFHSLRSEPAGVNAQSTNDKAVVASVTPGGVLVQKMVAAEYAGVMFTEHPNNAGASMIEMVAGLGEQLTSGNIVPKTYSFGKFTGELLAEESSAGAPSPIKLAPLLALGQELENLFGQPQDIEWAYAKGQFYILQTRDITRSITHGKLLKNLAEKERAKLLKCLLDSRHAGRNRQQIDPTAALYVQNELSEAMPRLTPLSADLMRRTFSAGGSTDLAHQDLGIPYKVHDRSMPYINTIFGWTYVNKQEEKQRIGKGPSVLISFQLSRTAQSIQTHFRDEFLPVFKSEMIERDAIALDQLSLDDAINLLKVWVQRFVEETHFEAQRVTVSADFYMQTALAKFRSTKLDPALYFKNQEDVVSQAIASLKRENITAKDIEQFLKNFGHRAALDYELAVPRFAEDLNLLRQYIERCDQGDSKPQTAELKKLPKRKSLKLSIQRALDFLRLKDEAIHYCTTELAQIRHLLIAIDNKLQLDGRIFQLSIDEVIELADPSARPRLFRLADERFEAWLGWKTLQLPASLSVRDLERIDMLTGTLADTQNPGDLAGKRVAGIDEIFGTVRVITDVDQIHTFKHGEILVARMADPSWYPLFAQARGIITEAGGWLTHTAVIAREHDLPAIVGVFGACERLNTGDVVRMGPTGSVDLVSERRAAGRQMRSANGRAANDAAVTATANSEAKPQNIYQLTNHKLFRFSQGIERRAMKQRVTERRRHPRFTENGKLQLDRRLANRLANAEKLRKAS